MLMYNSIFYVDIIVYNSTFYLKIFMNLFMIVYVVVVEADALSWC